MAREISLKELYQELYRDPDLRRLGRYKVVATEGQVVLPIDLDLDGRDVYLGEGDFRNGFVAFSDTKVRSLDLGTSKFTDLYLDNLEAEALLCGEAHASRLYFDYALVAECRFNDFVAPEVYFDEASIGEIAGENLRSGIIYSERLNSPGFKPTDISGNTYRIMTTDSTEVVKRGDEGLPPVVRDISVSELKRLVTENPNLQRLGLYKVVPEDGSAEARILDLNLDVRGGVINLGHGDFTQLKVRLGETKADLVDLANSKFDAIDFADAEIGECFLGGSEIGELGFGRAKIVNIYGEQSKAGEVRLDNLDCQQLNANRIQTRLFELREAHVRELYLSRGDGIENMYFDSAQLELLNLHEGEVRELHFGQSVVDRALINKASVKELNIEHLRASNLYIGDYKNEIDNLKFGEGIEGIKTINIDEAFRAARRVLGNVEGYASRWPRELKEPDDGLKESVDTELHSPKEPEESDLHRAGEHRGEKRI